MSTGGGGGANGRGTNGSSLPSVFDVCVPRKDIRDGIVESELAADLSQAVSGEGPPEYSEPERFFASTYPTRGIKGLLHNVLTRLKGESSQSVFWLNTSFGGGKTHALIALLHAAKSPAPDIISEFADSSLLPRERVRIAIFDGQNADISNGHSVGGGIRARTPWGEIAYGLSGKVGYNRINDDISGSPPGADTLRELIGDGPTLVLLDELAVYLRKAAMHEGAGKQFVAFLTALIKAVEGSPNAALVYTLAAGSSEDSDDAYQDENRTLVAELANVSARKAMLLNPTEEGETIQILRRRLFERRDEGQVDLVVDAYRRAWKMHGDKLSDAAEFSKTVDEFRAGYPLHPDILSTLISKTSTLENFQRIRGMLRILGYVVHDLWMRRDKINPITAIHLHHFDIGNESMRLEIASKLRQDRFAPAIDTDIACDDANKTSLAQRLDKRHYPGMPPYTTYVARVVFMNTLAFNQQLKGVDARHLRYSILWPGIELAYVDEALARFREESQYLDDNPDRPTQFSAVPNLSQAIQRAERGFEESDLEAEVDKRIRNMFQNGEFDLCLFPDGHEDVPDDAGSPKLVMPKYDSVTASNPESAPGMVDDIFKYKGIGDGGFRGYRNNLVFLVAFEDGVAKMYAAARRHLAMSILAAPGSMASFADYQQKIIGDKKKSSDDGLDDAILKCYKYLYYPAAGNRLAYTTMDWKRGRGARQQDLVEKLRGDVQKIRTSKDRPDHPESLVDQISKFRNNGEMNTQDFRNEFYADTTLPILIGNEVFEAGILLGIKQDVFVYKSGELICGKGDPDCKISIDEHSVVYTVRQARKRGIWPRGVTGETGTGKSDKGMDGGEPGGTDKKTEEDTASGFDLSAIRADGKPSHAVRSVWDELRKHGAHKVSKMRVESKDDVFPLLSMIGRVREFEADVEIQGDCSIGIADSVFNFSFTGTLKDSEPVQEFLKPHMRESGVSNLRAILYIKFKDDVGTDWLEVFADRLKLVENDVTISDIEGKSK